MELNDFLLNKNDDVSGNKLISIDSNKDIYTLISNDIAKTKKFVFVVIAFDTMMALFSLSRFLMLDSWYKWGYFLLLIGFVAGAIYAYYRSRNYYSIDYSLPMMEFLTEVENKLRFMGVVDYIILVPVLCILGIGGGIILVTTLGKYFSDTTLLTIVWVCLFIAFIIFSITVSKKDHYKRYGSMLELIKKIREEQNQ